MKAGDIMQIREAMANDAGKILNYCKIIGDETNNLTFGKEGVSFTIEQEKEYLDRCFHSINNIYIVAEDNDEIIGACNLTSSSKERLKHNAEIGISVRKDHWGKGIASIMLKKAIYFARGNGIKNISLNVRSDNERAKTLYKKFGFKKIGTIYKYLKIDGEYFDCDIMQLFL